MKCSVYHARFCTTLRFCVLSAMCGPLEGSKVTSSLASIDSFPPSDPLLTVLHRDSFVCAVAVALDRTCFPP